VAGALVGASKGDAVGSEVVGLWVGALLGADSVGALVGTLVGEKDHPQQKAGQPFRTDVPVTQLSRLVMYEHQDWSTAPAPTHELVGTSEGAAEAGAAVGCKVVGNLVGVTVGSEVVGEMVGKVVGLKVGCSDGDAVTLTIAAANRSAMSNEASRRAAKPAKYSACPSLEIVSIWLLAASTPMP
jgi:hypothetical protein